MRLEEVPQKFQKRIRFLLDMGMPESLIEQEVKRLDAAEARTAARRQLLQRVRAEAASLPEEMEHLERVTDDVLVTQESSAEFKNYGRGHTGLSFGQQEFYNVVTPVVPDEAVRESVWERYISPEAGEAGWESIFDLLEAAEDGDELAVAIIELAERRAAAEWVQVKLSPAPQGLEGEIRRSVVVFERRQTA